MRITWTAVGVATALALAAGPVSAAAQTAKPTSTAPKQTTAPALKPTDKSMDDRIEKRIAADAGLKQYSVSVDVENGVAKLTGAVPTAAMKTRAGTFAKVTGITKVDNQLVVDKDAPKTVTAKAKEAISKTGEVITDTWILTKVKASFVGEDALKGSDINADVANKVVTLKGTVKSEAGRLRAITLAKETEGVVRVVDQLKIVK
jgi:hyperosmotically inducible periplasmic protein